MLTQYVPRVQKSHITRFRTDQRATTHVFLARILWLLGFPEQAVRAAENSIEIARAANPVTALCNALAHAACPIALWTGDLTAAESYVCTLLDHSTRHALPRWHAWGRGHQGALAVKRGDVTGGLRLLRSCFDEFREGQFAPVRLIALLMAEALGRAGQIADGLVSIDEVSARSERTEERWLVAELLRIKGELLLAQDAPEAAPAAEDNFRQALDWAHRQGALSWELRAGTSLARLLRDQGRSAEALALLQPVYDRFTEGFDTADLKTAKALLDALAEPVLSSSPVGQV
jgi:predicted ATPase